MRFRITCLTLLLVTANCSALGQGTCATTQKFEQRQQEIEFLLGTLDSEQLKADAKCYGAVIRRLGALKSTEAVPKIIALLTFREPEPATETGGFRIHPVPEEDRYPAVQALMQMGKSTLPALTNVIASHNPTSLEHRNATFTVVQILRDDPRQSVAFFSKAVNHAVSPEEVQRFSASRDFALKRCLLVAQNCEGASAEK